MNNFDLHTNKIPSGFKTPDGYFDGLENSVLAKINAENDTNTKVFALNRNKKLWFTAVAAVLALLFCLPMLINSNKVTLEKVETASLESYLATEFSSYELAEKLNSVENIEITDVVTVSDDDMENYFEYNQNLENYLSE